MKINIDKPCTEDWNSMKIGMVSRHCDVCDKGVFDFTNKSKEEILTFLIQNNNQSVCGKLKKSQLDFHHEELEVIIEGLKKQKNNKYAFAILSLTCLMLLSCGEEEQEKSQMLEQITLTDEIYTKDIDEVNIESDRIKEEIIITKTDESNEPSTPYVTTTVLPDIDLDHVILGNICVSPKKNDNSVNINGINDSLDALIYITKKMPEFIGGIDSLFSFLRANIVYPEWEKKNDIQGKVYVNFTIEKDGSISSVNILRSVEGAKNFDKEVIRVMNLMPNWIPGENEEGEKVRVQYNLPFNFKLKDS